MKLSDRIAYILNNTRLFYLLMFGGFVISLSVLARPVVTPLGLHSFGGIWQYHINYSDFGFIRRALVGSFVHLLRLDTIVSDKYLGAYMLFSAILAGSFLIFVFAVRYLDRRDSNPSFRLFAIMVAYSPATFLHWAYSNGNLDLPLFIVFSSSLIAIYLRKHYLVPLLILVGLLIHEAYIVFVPSVVVLLFLSVRDKAAAARLCAISVSFAIAQVLVLSVFGRLKISEGQFKSSQLAQTHALFEHSGYFELHSGLLENFKNTYPLLTDGWTWVMMIPALLYVIATIVFASRFLRVESGGRFISEPYTYVIIMASLAPLGLFLIADDFYRWICMVSQILFAVIVFFVAQGWQRYRNVGPWLLAFLFGSAMFGPIGSACCTRPLPLFQFGLERLFHLTPQVWVP